MKSVPVLSSILAITLAISTPHLGLAHVGHGDEFQAEGGIERVKVNPETDSLLGIVVAPIEQASTTGAGVMIPDTALVSADGKELVFVKYNDFYEPVPVTTAGSQDGMLEVTEGLSLGENLVTQGSLSLYAESRKTQTAEEAPNSEPETVTISDTEAASEETGENDSTPQTTDVAQATSETDSSTGGFPMGILAALGGGVALLGGVLAVMSKRKS